MPKSIRFRPELERVVQAHADALDRSFSWVVTRTMEQASQGWDEVVAAVVAGAKVRVEAGSLAPVEKEPEIDPARVDRGASTVPSPASPRPTFKCRVARCEFRAKSPAAKCGLHGRTVVPV